ncbi:MAG: lysine--tRNA ligase [Myxococcota bacterium]
MDEPVGGLEQILRVRREKRDKLAEQGWRPYPNGLEVTHRSSEVRAGGEAPGEVPEGAVRFRLGGRLLSIRGMGKAVFADLWDRDGKIQIQVRKDLVGEEVFARSKLLDIGDLVVVEGPRFTTRRGELTIQVEKIELATKSMHPLPDKHAGLQDVEQRYRQRYVDLIVNRDVRTAFERRIAMIKGIRDFLDQRRFLEVETPILHELLTGAAARPFKTHHNALDMALFCRIAPELHLKRLIVGGLERVYEIGRSFRNEGLSTRHNPEFTMLEFYMAFATYEDLMWLTEEMLSEVSERVTGSTQLPFGGWNEGETPITLDLAGPYPRIPVLDGILDKRPGLDIADPEAVGSELKQLHVEAPEGTPLGKLQMELFEALWEAELVQPTFVVDFPTAVSPLARKKDSNPELTDRFELYVGGRELANGFSELNDPEDQRARFDDQLEAKRRGDEDAMDADEDYCHALEIGMPPTAGEGIGIDRLAMILTNAPSIRDVILFPLLRKLT